MITREKLISKLKTVERNKWSHSDIFEFFGIFDYDEEKAQTHVYTKDIITWTCTDKTVGLKAIYLDDVFIGITWQQFRKRDITTQFLNVESYNLIKAFALSCVELSLEKPEFINLVNLTEVVRSINRDYTPHLIDNLEQKVK